MILVVTFDSEHPVSSGFIKAYDAMLNASLISDMSSVSLGDTVSQHLIDDIQFNLVSSRLAYPMLNASLISDMSSVSLGDTGL